MSSASATRVLCLGGLHWLRRVVAMQPVAHAEQPSRGCDFSSQDKSAVRCKLPPRYPKLPAPVQYRDIDIHEMSAESWESRKAEFAIPLLQFTVAHYLSDAQVTDTIRRLILSEPAQEQDERNWALILWDVLNEGITASHHYATVLNLARRRAGKTWLNPVPETHDLTLKALACMSQAHGRRSADAAVPFLSSALTLFELLNSPDVDINEDDVGGLLARLWKADPTVALAVYRRTPFRETYIEAASELIDAGARPLKVLGLIADALQTQHMEGLHAAHTFAVPHPKVKKSKKAKSVRGNGDGGNDALAPEDTTESDAKVVQPVEDDGDDLRSEVGSQAGRKKRKKNKAPAAEE